MSAVGWVTSPLGFKTKDLDGKYNDERKKKASFFCSKLANTMTSGGGGTC
jgi:hypothetical protein